MASRAPSPPGRPGLRPSRARARAARRGSAQRPLERASAGWSVSSIRKRERPATVAWPSASCRAPCGRRRCGVRRSARGKIPDSEVCVIALGCGCFPQQACLDLPPGRLTSTSRSAGGTLDPVVIGAWRWRRSTPPGRPRRGSGPAPSRPTRSPARSPWSMPRTPRRRWPRSGPGVLADNDCFVGRPEPASSKTLSSADRRSCLHRAGGLTTALERGECARLRLDPDLQPEPAGCGAELLIGQTISRRSNSSR